MKIKPLLKAIALLVVLSPILPAQLNARALAATDDLESILADTESKVASVLQEQNQHARTAHDVEIVFGGKLISVVDASSRQITALGPSITPRLIKYIVSKASVPASDPGASYYGAIACTNALAKFGDVGFAPTLNAYKEHPDENRLLLNALLINFPSSLNFITKKSAKADEKDKKFYTHVVEEMLQHCFGQYFAPGVSQIAQAVRESNGPDYAIEPLMYTAEPVFRSLSPQAKLVGTDLLRLPEAMKSELVNQLESEKDEAMRRSAILSLGFMYPPDAKLLKPLEAILQNSGSVKDHPAAAESLGRTIFRLAALSPATDLSVQELKDAEAALKAVTGEHFSKLPAGYSLCELAAASSQDDAFATSCLEASSGGLFARQFALELMKLNSHPSADVVLPFLLKTAQASAPKELGNGGIQQSTATIDATKILSALKSDYAEQLHNIANNKGPSGAAAKTILDTNWSDRRVRSYREDLLGKFEGDGVLTDAKLSRLKNDLKNRDALAFNQTLYEIGRYGKAAAVLVPNIMTEFTARNLGDSQDARQVELCLENIGPGAAQTVPWLITKMSSHYSGVSLGAIQTLGAIGPAANSSEQPLRAFAAQNPRFAAMVSQALVKMNLQPVSSSDQSH